jgi:uracil-DNA glycosylase family 4
MAKLTIGPSGPVNARIMIVGDVPNEQDLRRGEPFIGGGGFEMTKMLQEAGIRREDCYLTTVFKSRIFPGTLHIIEKKKDRLPEHVLFQRQYITRDLFNACMDLLHEIDKVKPNVICTVGNLALFALTGETSSYNYRSSIMDSVLLQGYKVIPTLNVDAIYAQWAKRNWMVHDFKRVKRNSETPGLFIRDYSRLIAENNSDEQFQWILGKLIWLSEYITNYFIRTGECAPIAADIETRGGHITCISFAWEPTKGLCVQLSPLHNAEGFWSVEQEAQLVLWICHILMHRHVLLVGQNFNYDLQYIHRHWGILPSNVADTMLMQHSAFSNLPKNLGFLSSMYCEDHLYWKDDRTDWKDGDDGENEMKYWEYCTTDSCRTLAIYHVLKSVLKAMKMEEVNAFQQRLRPKVLKSMIRGVRVDQQKRSDLSMKLMQEMETRSQWMREVVGYDLNIRSPKQMQDFFYRQMGIRPVRSQTGGITTADAALHTIANREPILWPIVRKVQEMRSLGVFHSTFVMAPLDNDRRMRCSLNIAGTETYRFSSSKNVFGTGMNMQNIPKGGDTESGGLELPNIRELFIPDPGMTIVDIDLDSADARIVAWESDCAWLKECFKAGKKPYVEIMKEYYQDDSKNKKSPEYPLFKSLCHGTHYMGTAEGIAPRIGLDVRQTQQIQDWYFRKNPEIREWHERVKSQVRTRKHVENAFGYRVYFFDKAEGNIFNQAVADIPQSSVACLVNRIWDALEDDLPEEDLQVLLQVHDSLVFQIPTAKKTELLERVSAVGNSVLVPYADPLHIPMGLVSSEISWGGCQ